MEWWGVGATGYGPRTTDNRERTNRLCFWSLGVGPQQQIEMLGEVLTFQGTEKDRHALKFPACLCGSFSSSHPAIEEAYPLRAF